ncbi:MAG: type II toxin-antitoxin system YoeB family toxin [Synergistaceae bacterium]|nr:type II toxin-antitoxin system YoeB family toxin [Synergistaceae bacterium]
MAIWHFYLSHRCFVILCRIVKDSCPYLVLKHTLGKLEVLRHVQGYSRRIDERHRLVYRIVEGQNLRIISCKGHYE